MTKQQKPFAATLLQTQVPGMRETMRVHAEHMRSRGLIE